MYAHGDYDLWLDNQVVLARIKGQWNEDMAMRYAVSFNDIIHPIAHSDWAHIVYLDEWELATPEVEPLINQLGEQLVTKGLKCMAQVYSPNMLKKFQMDRIVRKVLGEFEQRVYPREEDAFSWLNEAGYPVTHKTLLP